MTKKKIKDYKKNNKSNKVYYELTIPKGLTDAEKAYIYDQAMKQIGSELGEDELHGVEINIGIIEV